MFHQFYCDSFLLIDRYSHFWAFTKPGPDRIGSDRIDKTRTGSDRINKTWIGLRPIDKTRTGSEKNRIAINFHQNSHETSHDQVLA